MHASQYQDKEPPGKLGTPVDPIHACILTRSVAYSREGDARIPLGDKAKVLPVVIDEN